MGFSLFPTFASNFVDQFRQTEIMPTGRHLTAREKEQIYFNFICEGKTVIEVYSCVFGGKRELISYRRLSEICTSLRHASDEEVDLFLCGIDKRKMFASI